MAWTASGIYASALAAESLTGVASTTHGWVDAGRDKFFMTTNSDTPTYSGTLAASIYSATNEATGTNWAAGGINVSALGAGPSSIAPTFGITGTTVLNYTASNVSVATTTISTAAYGGYFYSTVSTYKIIGIYFGGTGYTTVAGTFAITWSGGVICAITVSTAA
jgi:hypothetical protein